MGRRGLLPKLLPACGGSLLQQRLEALDDGAAPPGGIPEEHPEAPHQEGGEDEQPGGPEGDRERFEAHSRAAQGEACARSSVAPRRERTERGGALPHGSRFWAAGTLRLAFDLGYSQLGDFRHDLLLQMLGQVNKQTPQALFPLLHARSSLRF